jgi:hypothetical protein
MASKSTCRIPDAMLALLHFFARPSSACLQTSSTFQQNSRDFLVHSTLALVRLTQHLTPKSSASCNCWVRLGFVFINPHQRKTTIAFLFARVATTTESSLHRTTRSQSICHCHCHCHSITSSICRLFHPLLNIRSFSRLVDVVLTGNGPDNGSVSCSEEC